MLQLSKTGIELLKHFEGCELKAYQDSVGVWTIGYGHTKGIYEGLEITQLEAEKMLQDELPEYEGYVTDKVVPMLQQHEYDALVCWVYNLGPTNLSSSTLLKRLNAGEFNDVPFEMKRWDKAGGQPLLGLTRRRNAEALLCKGEQWKDYLEVEA